MSLETLPHLVHMTDGQNVLTIKYQLEEVTNKLCKCGESDTRPELDAILSAQHVSIKEKVEIGEK